MVWQNFENPEPNPEALLSIYVTLAIRCDVLGTGSRQYFISLVVRCIRQYIRANSSATELLSPPFLSDRFKSFVYGDLLKRNKVSLDSFG